MKKHEVDEKVLTMDYENKCKALESADAAIRDLTG